MGSDTRLGKGFAIVRNLFSRIHQIVAYLYIRALDENEVLYRVRIAAFPQLSLQAWQRCDIVDVAAWAKVYGGNRREINDFSDGQTTAEVVSAHADLSRMEATKLFLRKNAEHVHRASL